jgi:ferredoxin
MLSKLSPNRIVRNEEKCAGCGFCSKACPMNIDVAHLKRVTSAECIGCRECVNACPVKGALSSQIGSLEIPAVLVPVAAAAVFSGSVYLATSFMPKRGERTQRAGGEQEQGIKQGNTSQPNTNKVSFGGCSNCNGCGFCESASKA